MTTPNKSVLPPTPAEAAKVSGSELRSGDGLGASAPTWLPLLDVVRLLYHPNFYWGAMNGLTNLKYINLWIDTRDNRCVLTDRDGKPVTIERIQRGLDAPTMAEMNENPAITITESSPNTVVRDGPLTERYSEA